MRSLLRRALVVSALLFVCQGAAARDLAPGYIEGGYARTLFGRDYGGPTEEGGAVSLRIPLADDWFVTAAGQRLNPYVDGSGTRFPEEVHKSIGIGARSRDPQNPQAEWFARLVYLDISDSRHYVSPQPHAQGGELTFGARSMITPIIESSLEGGLGGARHGSSDDRYWFIGRAEFALLLVSDLWAYASGEVSENSNWQAGLRWSLGSSKPPPRPLVVHAAEPGPGPGPVLAVGKTVITERALQLQARPTAGAPETVAVPAGATLQLLETTENTFGNWWRVSVDGQEGWIRESWLR